MIDLDNGVEHKGFKMNNEHDATRIGELEREVSSLRNDVLRSRRAMRYWFLAALVVFALRDVFLGQQFWLLVLVASPILLFFAFLWRLCDLISSIIEPVHAERMNPSKLFASQQAAQRL